MSNFKPNNFMSDAAAITHFTEVEKERFTLLDKACKEGRDVFFLVGISLGEIRDNKLYMIEGFKSFADYAEDRGFTRRYCDQLIFGSAAVKTLPPKLRDLVKNDSAARALARIPEKLRPAVVAAASGDGKKKVTAAEIKKITPSLPTKKKAPTMPTRKKKQPEPEPEKFYDETGVEIPDECLASWLRAKEGSSEILSPVFELLESMRKKSEIQDIIYTEVDFNGSIAALASMRKDLARVRPYAICHSCNGKTPKDCPTCKGRGFVSKFYWETLVPVEFRKMRPKGC
jgi:hypothetical protein